MPWTNDSAEEALDDFTVALQSFQMMFSARIIVILSGCTEQADLLDRLISIGVVNVVTADTLQEATEEILEALSPDGMKKYLPHFNFEEPPARAVPQRRRKKPSSNTSGAPKISGSLWPVPSAGAAPQ